MNCSKVCGLLSPYIDDQLTARQRSAVESHLAGCPDCARELASLRQTIQLAATGLPQQELPDGFQASLSARLQVAQSELRAERAAAAAGRADAYTLTRPSWSQRLRSGLRRPIWRGALATAAAVLLVFSAAQYALPGWNGNVWSLLRSRGEYVTGIGTDVGAPDISAKPPAGAGGTEGTDSGTKTDPGSGLAALPDSTTGNLVSGLVAGPGDAQIIRTANITVEVTDFTVAEREVGPIIDAAGGFIEQASMSLDGAVHSGWFRLRVPQAKFAETLAKLEALGTVTHKEIGSEDVAAQMIDMEARIANLRRQELRYNELLGQAKSLDEVLRIENELNRVRYQIESYEGQLKWYRDRVAWSSIYMNLTEPTGKTSPVPGADLWARLWKAFVATWKGIGLFLEGFVVFVASVAPVVLLIAATWYGIGKWRRQHRSRE